MAKFKATLNAMQKDYELFTSYGYDFMMVFVSVDGGVPEVIINPKVNVDAKMVYYRSAYDNDLRLKANPKIQIVDYGFIEDKKKVSEIFRYVDLKGAEEL